MFCNPLIVCSNGYLHSDEDTFIRICGNCFFILTFSSFSATNYEKNAHNILSAGLNLLDEAQEYIDISASSQLVSRIVNLLCMIISNFFLNFRTPVMFLKVMISQVFTCSYCLFISYHQFWDDVCQLDVMFKKWPQNVYIKVS